MPYGSRLGRIATSALMAALLELSLSTVSPSQTFADGGTQPLPPESPVDSTGGVSSVMTSTETSTAASSTSESTGTYSELLELLVQTITIVP